MVAVPPEACLPWDHRCWQPATETGLFPSFHQGISGNCIKPQQIAAGAWGEAGFSTPEAAYLFSDEVATEPFPCMTHAYSLSLKQLQAATEAYFQWTASWHRHKPGSCLEEDYQGAHP